MGALLLTLLVPMRLATASTSATPPSGAITLTWDACSNSNAMGYVIYHGPVGGGFTNSTVLDNCTTTATLSNLAAGLTYFFFVTTYDAQSVESAPSNIIFDTPLPVSDTNTVTLSNSPPRLAPIANQTVTAGQLLSFTATATDTNVPAQTLTFSLAAGAPAGASIDPVSGVFTWTPSQAQGGVSTSVTIQVSDSGSPSLSATQTVVITVTPVSPPSTFVITAAPGTAPESVLLSWSATNPSWIGYIVSFGVVGGGVTNLFSVEYAETATVDNLPAGVPHFFFVTPYDDHYRRSQPSEMATVTPLAPLNSPPTLSPIGAKTVTAGTLLTFAVTATDSDSFVQALTFSLAPGAPAGATIDPATGAFAWAPARALGGSTNHVTICVTDDGSPALSATQTVAIEVKTVNPPPTPALSGTAPTTPGTVALNWTASTDPFVTGYVLRYGLAGGVTNTLFVTATSVILTNLQGGAGHFFFVAARNDLNMESLPSNLLSLTPTAPIVNTAPRLAVVGNKVVTAGTLLSFKVTATDTDTPPQTLTFSAAGAPAGASINPATGTFSWTPARTLGGTTNSVTFRVTGNGSPVLSDTQTITISVGTVSLPSAPTLSGSVPATPGTVALNWTASTDPFVTGYVLRYGLTGGATNTLFVTTTSVILTNLQGGAAHFFFVAARNDLNMESLPSNLLSLTPTAPIVNTAPHLTFIGNKAVTAGTLLNFTVAATDSDSPTQTLTFSIASATFSGASLDPVTGAFSWAPARTLGDATNYVTFRVTDSGSPSLSDTQTIAIAVKPVAPSPASMLSGAASAAPGTVTLNWTASADSFVTGYVLHYGLAGGATNTLFFTTTSATLTSLQSGEVYFFFVTARNDLGMEGVPSNLLTLTPATPPVNTAPRLNPIGNKTVAAGNLLTFAVKATDTDVPAQTLTFDLSPGAPAGAGINPLSGTFTWTPGEAQAGTTNLVTIRVTDNGTPALADAQTFAVIVTALAPPTSSPPTELRATLSGTRLLQLAWNCADENVDAFRVERSLDGVTFATIATTGADARNYAMPESVAPYAFAYPYVFRVCAVRGGQFSPYSNPACALTNQADLVITAIRTVPTFPIAGEPVVFKATIQNKGAVATPQGLNARVAFYVDGGSSVAWADNSDTLWPGQSVTVTANAGPNGTNTWIATAGNVTVTAVVDDATLVPEQDEENNNFDTQLLIAPASAPVVSVTVDQSVLVEGSNTVATFTFTRTGSTAADLPVQVNISGTARDGSDYRYISNVVVIPARAVSLSIPVTPTDDLLVEAKETMTLSLVPSLDYQMGDDYTATLFIQDNDKSSSTGTSTGASDQRSTFTTVSARPDAAGQMVVTWASVPGATYRIFARDSLAETGWAEVCAGVSATGAVTRWTNSLPDAATSYAISLVK